MTDIDAVAEAIRSAIIEQLKRRQDWYASPPAGYLVSDGVQKTPDELAVDGSFELMPVAQAAIDALQLTQEWAFEFTEPLSGNRKHYPLPEFEARQYAAEAQPDRDAAALSRLVSPWVEEQP